MTTHGVSRPYAGEGCGAGVGWVRQRWARGVGAGEKWCMSGCRRGAWARGRGWRVWVGMGAGRGRGAWVYWGVGAGRGRGTWARGVGAGIDVEEDEALVLELLCWPLMMDWASLVLGGHCGWLWGLVHPGAAQAGRSCDAPHRKASCICHSTERGQLLHDPAECVCVHGCEHPARRAVRVYSAGCPCMARGCA